MSLLQGCHNQSPAGLFLYLWELMIVLRPDQRSGAPKPTSVFTDTLYVFLSKSEAEDVFRDIQQHLDCGAKEIEIWRGNVLAAMVAIDNMFLRVHPRSQVASSEAGSRPVIPSWLNEVHESYLAYDTAYAENEKFRLIPRGPLGKYARDEAASNADSLADRFAALAVVPRFTHENYRSIPILHKSLSACPAHGYPIRSKLGSEKIAFIPVAEDANHIEVVSKTHNGNSFVDFKISSILNVVDVVINVLNTIEPVDIAMAPEFVMPECEADKVAEALVSSVTQPPRMLVLGSGQTSATDGGLPWNELRVLNSSGTELWRQRKVWPAALKSDRVVQYGLTPSGAELVYEYTASGTDIVISDVPSIGRCLVLICQDVEADFAVEVIKSFQPDWVFVPIMDSGIRSGGWVHQRAFALSKYSQARFLICSSLSLAQQPLGIPDVGCGLAIGPQQAAVDTSGDPLEKSNFCDLFPIKTGSSPGYAIFNWQLKARTTNYLTLQVVK